MSCVYRYTDLEDGIIKYVGIVWKEGRTLEQRTYEHAANDYWTKGKQWNIEYFDAGINTRTDAEYFESHFIALFETDKYYNRKKSGWGVSSFLPTEVTWKRYQQPEKNIKINKQFKLTSYIRLLCTNLYNIESVKEDKDVYRHSLFSFYSGILDFLYERGAVNIYKGDNLEFVMKEIETTFNDIEPQYREDVDYLVGAYNVYKREFEELKINALRNHLHLM